jgi:hypothetical protein
MSKKGFLIDVRPLAYLDLNDACKFERAGIDIIEELPNGITSENNGQFITQVDLETLSKLSHEWDIVVSSNVLTFVRKT